MRLSLAASILENAMFGNLPRHEAVSKLKREHGDSFKVRLGLHREQAGREIRKAILLGRLKVFVILPEKSTPETLPTTLIPAIITARGVLPDLPTRIGLSTPVTDRDLAQRTCARGLLAVDKNEFENWLVAERKKRRWRSQVKAKKQPVGRPKLSDAWDERIEALVQAGEWIGEHGVSELRRLLERHGDPPSVNTLRTRVDERFRDTRDDRYHRRHRRPPSSKTPLRK